LARLVLDHLEKIDELQDEVIKNAEKLTEVIDLDMLLKSPEEYLNKLGLSFLSEHIDEIEKGAEEGKSYAKKILKNV
jgi:adenylate kinase